MLKFLFFIFVGYLFFKGIGLILRLIFNPFDRHLDEQQRQQQNFFRNQANGFGFQQDNPNRNEGQVRIYKNSEQPKDPNDRKDVLKDFGDYTDFEEVK